MLDLDLRPEPQEGEFAFLRRLFANPVAKLIREHDKDENPFPPMPDGRQYRPNHDVNGKPYRSIIER